MVFSFHWPVEGDWWRLCTAARHSLVSSATGSISCRDTKNQSTRHSPARMRQCGGGSLNYAFKPPDSFSRMAFPCWILTFVFCSDGTVNRGLFMHLIWHRIRKILALHQNETWGIITRTVQNRDDLWSLIFVAARQNRHWWWWLYQRWFRISWCWESVSHIQKTSMNSKN